MKKESFTNSIYLSNTYNMCTFRALDKTNGQETYIDRHIICCFI